MLERRIANRYTEALFGLAQQQQQTEAWEGQLASLAEVFASTPELLTILAHPEISLARKGEIMQQAFGGKVAPEILQLLQLLMQRGHELDIRTLREVYRELWDAARQVVPVTVTTAIPLTDMQTQQLAQTLAVKLQATVRLQQQIDPDIIAGMIVQMGDRVIDASTRAMLASLRESMRNA